MLRRMRGLIPFLLATLTTLGCGSTDEGGSATGPAGQAAVEDACAATCSSLKKCSSAFDETKCLADCKADATEAAQKYRADYVSLIASCFRTASCDKLKDCDDQAEASIAPTAGTQSFCDAFVTKSTECKVSTDKARCLTRYKLYTDATLLSAQTCFSGTCLDLLGCLDKAI